MSIQEDRWFELWFTPSWDLRPTWILVVTPDVKNVGLFIVYDPQEDYRVVHTGENYDDTVRWLQEDEYSPVEGRTFVDDGFRLRTRKS